MASLPLANQVRQVYVASTLKETIPSALGELRVMGETGKFLYFQHYGHGGLTASDKIGVENIRSIKVTEAGQMKDYLKTHVVTVTTVSAGQVYVLKVLVHDYVGQGANDYTYRYGTYKAKNGDTAADIAAGLAASLQKAMGLDSADNASDISHYKEKLFTVTVNGAAVTVGEVDRSFEWELPRFPVSYCPVEILLNGIVTEDEFESFDWATIEEGDTIEVNNVGKKLAELEYYAHGWRGDIHRGVGYPYTTNTKYMVDPTKDYDVIDIHYFFRGQGVSSQLSEKEITLIVPKASEYQYRKKIEEIVGKSKITAPETYSAVEGGDYSE